MEKIIPLLSVLFGGIVGFFASYLSNKQSNNFQIRHERILFIRTKKEDLYYLLAKIKFEYRGWMGNCLLKITHNKDMAIGQNEGIARWDELDLLVNLYFKDELGATVKKLKEKRDKVGDVIAKVITFKGGSQDRVNELNGKVVATFTSIDKDIDSLLSDITTIE